MTARPPVNATPRRKKLSPKRRFQVFLEGKGLCGICGEMIAGPFEIDHRIGLARGGLDEPPNWQAAHPACHLQKTRTIDTPISAKIKRQSDKCIARKGEERVNKRRTIPNRPWPQVTKPFAKRLKTKPTHYRGLDGKVRERRNNADVYAWAVGPTCPFSKSCRPRGSLSP